jgi:nucleotide sugar dehydrogenase
MIKNKKVAVIGCGKVGIPYAVRLSELGYQVNAFDNNPNILDKLLIHENPFPHEPGINLDLVDTKKTLKEAVSDVDFIFSIVPTPQEGNFLSGYFVRQSLDEIGAHLTKDTIVVVVSTLDPRTAKADMAPRKHMRLVYSPPLIRLGTVKADLQNAKILFLGSNDTKAQDELQELWYPKEKEALHKSDVSFRRGSIVSIAMAKMAINYSLSVKVGLANDIAAKCEALGADPEVVLGAVGSDPRINALYMKPGNSPGGPCIYRDQMVFSSLDGGGKEFTDGLTKWHSETHKKLKTTIINRILAYNTPIQSIGIAGVAYNPGGLDITNSIGLAIARDMCALGDQVNVFDPASKFLLKQEDEQFKIISSLDDLVMVSDAIIVGCMWNEIKSWYREYKGSKPVEVADWRK